MIKELKKHNDTDIPDALIDPIIKHLNYEEGNVKLISEKDIDHVFIGKEINWRIIVKYISFNIVHFYAINAIDISINFLDKDGNEIYIDDDRYIPDKIEKIIPDLHEVPTRGGGELLVNCFESGLLNLFKEIGIKFVQGSNGSDDGITDLDVDDRLMVVATDDT